MEEKSSENFEYEDGELVGERTNADKYFRFSGD